MWWDDFLKEPSSIMHDPTVNKIGSEEWYLDILMAQTSKEVFENENETLEVQKETSGLGILMHKERNCREVLFFFHNHSLE